MFCLCLFVEGDVVEQEGKGACFISTSVWLRSVSRVTSFLNHSRSGLAVRRDDLVLFEQIEDEAGKPARVGLLNIVMVQPEQFLGIEDRGRLADVFEGERLDQLLRENISWSPWDQPRRAR